MLDTNLALRAYDSKDPSHIRIHAFLQSLSREDEVFVCPQVVFELRVVLTRPSADNGFGLTGSQFDKTVSDLLKDFSFLPDPHDLLYRWMRLCDENAILGKQSHDARLVAWMEAYGVDSILTLNTRHFAVFESIQVLTP